MSLVAPLLAFFIAAASPGPATLAVAATAMARGRRAGLLLGTGLAIGVTFWGALTALGLGALLLLWAPALLAVKVAGGLYLLYLAWLSAKSALSADETRPDRAEEAQRLVTRGLTLNLMNPKAVLAWSAAIAVGVPGDGTGGGWIAAIVGLCAIMCLGIYSGYALLFSAPPIARGYARARRWCEAVFALGFSAAGLRLIFWRGEAA
ncbi:MAG: LysE family translocator [Pseudomonadota bacterium]